MNKFSAYRLSHALFTSLVLFAVLGNSLFAAGSLEPAQALTPPALQYFYVTLPEDVMLQYFDNIFGAPTTPVRSVISVAIGTTGTVVYYDQWEDGGYDIDIANPGSNTYNASTNADGTQIWGDGVLSNGCVPVINNIINPCASPSDDSLVRGQTITLDNYVNVNGTTPGPYTRNAAEIYFDGKDKLATTLPVAMSRALWPSGIGSLVADAQGILPTERWGTQYVSPVGENLNATVTNGSFEDVRYLVMAGPIGSTISVDFNADGDYADAGDYNNYAMTEGQVLSINDATGTTTVNRAGARINVVTGSPVQVTLLTGDVGSTYENRFFNLIPRTDWVNDYYSPVGTAAGASCTSNWFYNPNAAPITVNYDFPGGASPNGTFNVAANSAVESPDQTSGARYYTTGAPPLAFLPISGTDCFSGGAGGGNGDIYDWGNELYPVDQLSPEILVGWAPGCTDTSYEGVCLDADDTTRSNSRTVLWLTPLANTTIYVDTNGSGISCPGGAGAEKTITATALTSYQVDDNPTSGTRYYVHDNFGTQAFNRDDLVPNGPYTGVDSTQNWSTNWTETGDDGAANNGAIWITGGALQFRDQGGNETNVSIQRGRNLNGRGYSRFSFRAQFGGAYNADDGLAVEISPDGTNWTTLEVLRGPMTFAAGQLANRVYRTSAYDNTNTRIRFRTVGNLEAGDSWSIDEVHIDDTLNGDYDMTGSYIRTCDDVLLSSAFGQDPARSFSGDDEAMDLGMGVPPYGSQIRITKAADRSYVSPGDLVTYSYTVKLIQTFSTSVNNVEVKDDKCAPATYVSGDTSNTGYLDPGETWTFTCTGRMYTDTTNYAMALALYGTDRIRSAPAYDTVFMTSSLGDYVWVDEDGDGGQDAGEPGIPNVKLILTGNDFDNNPVSRTTYTDATGHYVFKNMPPSNASGYTVTVDTSTMAAGLVANQTYDENGLGTANATTVVLGSDLRYKTADFGYNWSSTTETNTNTGTGMIGDRVWSDADGDGIQDLSEPGLFNIIIELDSAGPDDLFNTYDDVIIATTTTDNNGNYAFDGLSAGAYQVRIPAVFPGYTQTADPDLPATPCNMACDGMTTIPIVLAPGDVYLNADFGYQLDSATGATIGDTLWVDTNRNNSVDAGETGLLGVSVSLIRDLNANGVWDAGEPIINTTITDANGNYSFTGVPVDDGTGSDDYLVWVNDISHMTAQLAPTYDSDDASPASGIATGLGISAVTDLDPGGAQNLAQDFAYAPGGHSAGNALVGDTIWLDQNGNGTYDVGEGLSGVVVNLIQDANANNIYEFGEPFLTHTITNENGQYFFGGLPDGTYIIDINQNSLPNFGLNLTNFADPDAGTAHRAQFTLTAGQTDLTQDFGYQYTSGYTIGGTLWNDTNTNGVLDGGEAGRYQGVTISLFTDSNDNGIWDAGDQRIGTKTTDSSGNYSFTGLPNDTYFVDVTDNDRVLNGNWNSLSAAGSDSNSQADPYKIVLNGVNNTTADFGYYRDPASLGDYVWVDTNQDGLQTGGEPGILNSLVTLTITWPSGATTVLNTLTDANGAYNFGNLLLDEDFDGVTGSEPTYSLTFSPPAGYVATTANVGGNDAIDSDGVTVANATITDAKGTYNNTIDSGFRPTVLTIAKTSNMVSGASAGDDITYTITVTNNTGVQHTGIAISDPLPSGTTYVSSPQNTTVATGYIASSFYYLDDFQTGLVYTGSGAGSAAWSTNWTETNDNPNGSATTGSMTVNAGGAACPSGASNCLRIQPNRNNMYISRTANMSTCNSSGTLSYTYNNTITSAATVAARIYVLGAQVGGNLATYTSTINRGRSSASFTLTPAQMAATTSVVFYVTPQAAGATYLYVDDVRFTCNSSTAMTKDNIPGGANPDLLFGTPPANLVVAGDGFSLAPSQSMTVTFHVTVNSPAALYSIDNTAGVNSTQMGAGIWQYASRSDPLKLPAVIGDRVWLDEDSNGIQDAGEVGIANVTLELRSSGCTAGVNCPTTVTDSEGNYLFTGVNAGTYTVAVINGLPAGLLANPTYDVNGISTPNVATVTVTWRQEYVRADFGYNWASTTDVINPPVGATGSIGDRLWSDANSNGLQDPGEPGLGGIPVRYVTPGTDGLFGTADDFTSAPVNADAAGNYIFDSLPSGAYQVVVNNGLDPTGYTQTGDPDRFIGACIAPACDNKTTTPILLAPGDVYVNADFGYHPNYGYTIGNQVFLDADGNGSYGGGDTAIPSVSVALVKDTNANGTWDAGELIIATTVTNTNGQYFFNGVPNGDYIVWVNDTAHVLDELVQNSRPNAIDNGQSCGICNGRNAINISGANNIFQDFGYAPFGHASGEGMIGDTIFYDRDASGTFSSDEGLEGIRVRLFQGSTLIAETSTNENGKYAFGNLTAGSYTVNVVTSTLPFGVTNTVDPDTANPGNNQSTVSLGVGTMVSLLQDFGYRDITNPNTLSGTLWNDANPDGTLSGETGRFSGVTVVLSDLIGNIIATTTTDGSGNYNFPNLPDDTYSVHVTDASNVLNGYWHTYGPNPGINNNSQYDPYNTVTLFNGQTNETGDFGYYRDPAVIGDFVWNDQNGNGVQDGGEAGISGESVTLTVTYPNSNVVIFKTLTDSGGFYSFGNLLLDENLDGTGLGEPTFSVSVATPSGYTLTLTDQGANDNLDSDGTTITALPVESTTNNSYDTGFVFQLAVISDFVWADTDGDGVQDTGETGIDGVTVNLRDSTGTAILQTTTTAGGGLYSFTAVPGSYIVEFVTPSGYVHSPLDLGGDDTKDSDANTSTGRTATVVLAAGATNTTVDAGFYQNATLGNFVWLDRDNDGIQDSDEPGIRGATVNLLDTSNNVLQTATTGAGGAYSFTAAPGSYIVEFSIPGVSPAMQDQGADDALDSDASVATGRTGTITMTSGQTNNTVDAGFYTLRLDLGDLPDIYKTIFSPGPAHVVFPDGADADSNPDTTNGVTAVWLGTLVDNESNGVPDASAIGDDAAGSPDDEDGLVLASTGWTAAADPKPIATITVNSSEATTVYYGFWIDWNNDGDFADGDDGFYSGSQATASPANVPVSVTVPASYVPDANVYMRVRASDAALTSADYQGTFINGEVEDNWYKFDGGGTTTPVTLSYFQAQRQGNNVNFTWSTATETGNVGFNLYVKSGQKMTQINKTLIPSKVIDSLDRQDYSFSAAVKGNIFFIEDVSVLGEIDMHGPFKIGEKYGDRMVADKINQAAIQAEHEEKYDDQQKELEQQMIVPSSVRKSENKPVKPTTTVKPTKTHKPTKTPKTPKPTATPSPTMTVVPTDTPTETMTPTPTATAIETPTPTVEPTATGDPVVTKEPTATSEPTATETFEPTATATLEPTATATFEQTATVTLEPTATTTSEPTATATTEPIDPQLKVTYNFKVRQTGIYRVTYEMLRDSGLDLAGVPSMNIALTNRGQTVPVYVNTPTEAFGPGSFIEFYGEALDTIYTDTNIYTLQVSDAPVEKIQSDNTAPNMELVSPVSYTEILTVNNQRAFANYAPGADAWYDTKMLVYTTPKSWNFPFQVTSLADPSAPATLELVVWGVTGFTRNPDHHLRVSLNGIPLADQTMDGLVEQTLKITLPAGALHEGTNNIQLTLPGDMGVKYEVITLDKFSVTYQRVFQAQNGQLTFTAAGDVFNVTNLPSANVSVYRTENAGMARLENVNIQASGNLFTATFAGANQSATYLVTAAEVMLTPALEATRLKADLNHPAQYLIISHPDFINGIQPLVKARQMQGLTVSLVNVNDLYAQYSDGIFDPQAIKKYIAYAAKNLGTEYVLLVGGDTYDYRNFTGLNSISFIPSLYVPSNDVTIKFVPVDPLYADLNADNVPDLAIGRFPVRTMSELDLMITKTLEYAAKNYGRTAIFASDKFDGVVSFKDISNNLSTSLPVGWLSQNTHLDDFVDPTTNVVDVVSARNQLIAAMNNGSSLVTFTGHSSSMAWSFSNLFNTQNAAVLTNNGRPFVAVQWGCWNTYYVDPANNYLVQSLLFSGNNGAAAVFGAVTVTDSESERLLGNLLMPRLTTPGMPMGKALQDAKAELAKTRPELQDVLIGWALMGDPALVIEPK